MSELHIANPGVIKGFLKKMAVIVIAASTMVYVAQDFFVTAFMSNVPLNGSILTVFIIGTALTFLYVFHLKDDVTVISNLDELLFADENDESIKMHMMSNTLVLLRNNITSLGMIKLSAPATRSLINSLQDSVDDKIAFIRYFTDLLVFIGLLGTFLGLTITIASIGGILADLAEGLGGGGDIMDTLITLIKGLEGPLGGMGTAFGSSLMGLSSSLVLGILALNLNKASSYFTGAMENWLAQHTVESQPGAPQPAANQPGSLMEIPADGLMAPPAPQPDPRLNKVIEQLSLVAQALDSAPAANSGINEEKWDAFMAMFQASNKALLETFHNDQRELINQTHQDHKELMDLTHHNHEELVQVSHHDHEELLETSHKDLEALNQKQARMITVVEKLSETLEKSVQIQARQLEYTEVLNQNAEMQLRESEKLRALFSTSTNSSVEALGAIHESKQRLIQIVSSLLDEQKHVTQTQTKTTEQLDQLKEEIRQQPSPISTTDLDHLAQQIHDCTEKVEKERRNNDIRQSRMEKMMQAIGKAVNHIRGRG
ncbi:hypothetical protein [Endozoicomonas sp. Mp262]|uniref:hypothetical protein n=1 Tax=Endozoicomonas sp. Mp262 TaxID=2919499 RepID=UPI0021DAA729